MTNPHEDLARQRKATAISDMLDAFELSPDDAADFDSEQRLGVAIAAGVKPPSAETWTAAVDLLRHRLSVRASLAGTDPFAGLPS